MRDRDFETKVTHNRILETVSKRRSIRSFTEEMVTSDQILRLLEIVKHSPSGGNMQPWHVHVLEPSAIRILQLAIEEQISSQGFSEHGDYEFYPSRKKEQYWNRIRQSGQDLHNELGIGRRETQKIRTQKMSNFNFYGAPIGLIVTLDRELEKGSWVDVGVFLGILTTAITSVGLGCCIQGCFSSYGDIVRSTLALSAGDLVVCGVAIGYPQATDRVNNLPHRRLEVDEFVRIHKL